MAEQDIVKGHCPQCGPDRNADVKGHFSERFDDDDYGVWGRTDYRILNCRGCEATYMQTSSVFSEDVEHEQDINGDWREVLNPKLEHWPAAAKRAEPAWVGKLHTVNDNLADLFGDIYKCLNADLHVPAAVAVRTAFDSATELLGIDPGLRFFEKLDKLRDDGRISPDERQMLDIVVDAGSAAAHRGWRPTTQQLDTLVSLIETFFHHTFILGDEAQKIKAVLPAKQKAKKL